VASTVAVVFTLRPQREPVQAARLADRIETIFPPGQQFMDVALVAHVLDELVLGRVEDAVQSQRQFNDAQVRTEVPAVPGEHCDEVLPNFDGQFLELRQREFLHVLRPIYHVEISAHILVNG